MFMNRFLNILYMDFFCVNKIYAQPSIALINPLQGHPGSFFNIAGPNLNLCPGNNSVFFGAAKDMVTAAGTTIMKVECR